MHSTMLLGMYIVTLIVVSNGMYEYVGLGGGNILISLPGLYRSPGKLSYDSMILVNINLGIVLKIV